MREIVEQAMRGDREAFGALVGLTTAATVTPSIGPSDA